MSNSDGIARRVWFKRIPPEVHLLIIEALGYDYPSLASCSLVSRSWLSVSRTALFRCVIIHSSKEGPDRFEEFLTFLERGRASATGVGSHVKKLRVLGDPPPPPPAYDDEDSDEVFQDADDLAFPHYTPCSLGTIRGLLTYMPNLLELELRYLLLAPELETPCDRLLSTASASRPFTIQYLDVEDCSAVNKDVSTFFDLICLFSNIKNLAFTCGPWEAIPGARLLPSHPLPLIQELDMSADYECCTDGVYELLRRSGSLDGSLTRIELSTSSLDLVVPFFSFLPDAARYLVHLTLEACSALSEDPGMLPPELEQLLNKLTQQPTFSSSDLSPFPAQVPHFPALRTLVLDLDCNMDEELDVCQEDMRDVVSVYTRLLSPSASFPVLSTIEFRVIDAANHYAFWPSAGGPNGEPVDQLWDRFGQVLVDLPAIKEIVFELRNRQNLTYADVRVGWITGVHYKRFICAQMPALGARDSLYNIYYMSEGDLDGDYEEYA